MNPSPDFGWSLPPGCSERDIPGNWPDAYTPCVDCGKVFETDELNDDERCAACEKLNDEAKEAKHTEFVNKMESEGLVWCQPAGQWLYPENICKCGRARDMKDAKECSECEAVRFDYMRDFNREMGY